jgi:hypothetical protein
MTQSDAKCSPCSTKAQLPRILKTDASYYNQVRTHLALDKNTPDSEGRRGSAASQQYQFSSDSIINMFVFRF